MKKILFLVAVALFAASGSVYAQSKADFKEAKKRAKALTKQGYYSIDHHSIESHLVDFYELEEENQIFIGMASGYGNEKVAKNAARRDAMRECVEMANSIFKGIGDELEGKLDTETIDNLTMASTSKFEGRVADGMRVKFNIFKEENGQYSCHAYCYVSKETFEEAAKSAWQEAADQATKDAQATAEYSNEVTNLINNHEF